ncbi:MAG: hypothetical protein NTW19_10805 [Planctomycetota bacterium]|nr:hypothetical protein [Planctomycetota bacterium]
MKAFTMMVIVGLMLGFSSLALAKEHGSKPGASDAHKGLMGTVVSVTGTDVVIKTGKKDATVEKTIKTDDKTLITINHVSAKLADLTAGQHVKVLGADPGPATEIDVVVAHPKPKSDKPAK